MGMQVEHLVVAEQDRSWIAVLAPLRPDFDAVHGVFERPAARHLLRPALAAVDDFRKTASFVHVPEHTRQHRPVIEITPATDNDPQGVGVPRIGSHPASVHPVVSCCESGAVRLIWRDGEAAMPGEQNATPWNDLSEADKAAAVESWWAKASPEPGSDEYLILQIMSAGVGGHGDPQAARKELYERGLIEEYGEYHSYYTERGCEVFLNFLDRMTRIHDMSTAEPTPEGIQRHPPDGYFHTDAFGEPVREPCTCTVDCPKWCEGECGCDACATRLEVYAAPGSVYGEQ